MPSDPVPDHGNAASWQPIYDGVLNAIARHRLGPGAKLVEEEIADIYGIMEYFIGNDNVGLAGHDDVAEKIATEGKEWTERVLRKEDMQIYVFRLLLEYARLCDDDRDVLGWADMGSNTTA